MSSHRPNENAVPSRSPLDDAMFFAEPLSPNDRLWMIVRLWLSLPADHWAAPTDDERAELERKVAAGDIHAIGNVPWLLLEHTRPRVVRSEPAKVYSAPRRFDLATIFAVTTAYSLLFAAMSGLRFPATVSLIVAGFITGVGIGQAVLFGGNSPRLASVLTGIALYLVATLIAGFLYGRILSGEAIFFAITSGLMVGSITGYLAGVLVGGVFLVADMIRQKYGRSINSSNLGEAAVNKLESGQLHPLDAGPMTSE